MKHINLSKTVKVAAVASVFLTSFATQAADVSPPSIAEADVTFVSPFTISNVLIPVTGLVSGPGSAGRVLANGTITTTAGEATRHYLTFGTPGSLVSTGAGAAIQTTLKGQENTSNTVSVALYVNDAAVKANAWCSDVTDGCSGQIYKFESPAGGVSNYTVVTPYNTSINPDVYTIQTTAYGYAA